MDVNTYDKDSHLSLDTRVMDTMKVSFGFICGTNIGLPVLYASDGVLITIDGEYLMVQK